MRVLIVGATIALLSVQALADQPAPTPAPATQPDSPALQLVCRGTGEHKVLMGGSAFGFSGNRSAFAFGSSQQLSQFGEQLDVSVSEGKAKVRVPRRFLPPLHGGDGGWFDVSELAIGDSEITGKVAINFANHPNLRIDRRSGAVSLDGKVGSFAGQCEKFNPDQRAF